MSSSRGLLLSIGGVLLCLLLNARLADIERRAWLWYGTYQQRKAIAYVLDESTNEFDTLE